MTDHPVIPLQYLPICAALAAKAGMPEEEALKGITIYPAEILGLSDRIGSIGKERTPISSYGTDILFTAI